VLWGLFASELLALALLSLALLEALHEAIDLTSGVKDALLTSVERVALGTYVKAQALFGGNSRPL
jgi:hypothetical protein